MIPLDNLRKVAIVVSVLPQDEARQVMMGLNEYQISAVLRQISELRDMPLNERLPVLLDFVKTHMQHETQRETVEPLDQTRHLRYDEPTTQVPFGFLKDLPLERVADELRAECAETVALVLAHLPARMVSQLLNELPEPLKTESFRRLADMGPIDRDVIRDVEREIESRLSDCVASPLAQLGGVHFVAEVLRVADPGVEGQLLENITHDDPQLGIVIRRSLLRFSDIFRLSDSEIRTLMRHVETTQWAVALRGTDEVSLGRITDNLSETDADSLRQQMEWLGPIRRAKVDQMQAQIVDVLRRLRNARVIALRESVAAADA